MSSLYSEEEEKRMTQLILDDTFKHKYCMESCECDNPLHITNFLDIDAKGIWDAMWRKYRYETTEKLLAVWYLQDREYMPIRKSVDRIIRSPLHDSLVRNGKDAQMFFFHKMITEFKKCVEEVGKSNKWIVESKPPQYDTHQQYCHCYLSEIITGSVTLSQNKEDTEVDNSVRVRAGTYFS